MRPHAVTTHALHALSVILRTAGAQIRSQALLVAEAAIQYSCHVANNLMSEDSDVAAVRRSQVGPETHVVAAASDHLVPVLLTLSLTQAGEIRAYALKIAADAVAVLNSSRLVLAVRNLVPNALRLLEDGEPIPRYPLNIFVHLFTFYLFVYLLWFCSLTLCVCLCVPMPCDC